MIFNGRMNPLSFLTGRMRQWPEQMSYKSDMY